MTRDRDIEVLKLARRIADELESGRVNDVDMEDGQVEKVASLLAPPPPALSGSRPRIRPAMSAVAVIAVVLFVHLLAEAFDVDWTAMMALVS